MRVRGSGAPASVFVPEFSSRRCEAAFQQRVGSRSSIHPGDVGSAGPPFGGLYFESAIVRRIVRRRDHNPIRQLRYRGRGCKRVLCEKSPGGRIFVLIREQHLHTRAGRQHFERWHKPAQTARACRCHGTAGRLCPAACGNRNGLTDGQNMPFVESAYERESCDAPRCRTQPAALALKDQAFLYKYAVTSLGTSTSIAGVASLPARRLLISKGAFLRHSLGTCNTCERRFAIDSAGPRVMVNHLTAPIWSEYSTGISAGPENPLLLDVSPAPALFVDLGHPPTGDLGSSGAPQSPPS